MSITVDATYENGFFKPKQALNLLEGAEVRLTIRSAEPDDDPLAGLIGTFSSGRTDGAAKHDQYIYGDPRPRLFP
jgi:predicted DNA-binding antitoxin AbrB/MazE fold protein